MRSLVNLLVLGVICGTASVGLAIPNDPSYGTSDPPIIERKNLHRASLDTSIRPTSSIPTTERVILQDTMSGELARWVVNTCQYQKLLGGLIRPTVRVTRLQGAIRFVIAAIVDNFVKIP